MARGFSSLPISSLCLLDAQKAAPLALSFKSLKEVEDWSEGKLDAIWVSSEAASCSRLMIRSMGGTGQHIM